MQATKHHRTLLPQIAFGVHIKRNRRNREKRNSAPICSLEILDLTYKVEGLIADVYSLDKESMDEFQNLRGACVFTTKIASFRILRI